MRIRPATSKDHAAILDLAKVAGFGMTSLPADADVLEAKITASAESFGGNPARAGKETFLFVMEDPATDAVVGTTGIKAHVGLNQPFYSYKLTTITAQSRELDIFSKRTILNVTNDLTESSEIGSLFLHPEYRKDRLGRLLSLCRFLFMAAHPSYFAHNTIAELRGVHDSRGSAPFYDSIAKHFFEMEFAKADYINATQGNQFINDLMPKYPIYTHLLPQSAQDVIGQPHQNSEPARAMLEKQGFKWQGYVDIFDGGPTLQADTSRIRTIEQSQTATLRDVRDDLPSEKFMMTNERFNAFRACASRLERYDNGEVSITSRAAEMLEVSAGDTIRYISHNTG